MSLSSCSGPLTCVSSSALMLSSLGLWPRLYGLILCETLSADRPRLAHCSFFVSSFCHQIHLDGNDPQIHVSRLRLPTAHRTHARTPPGELYSDVSWVNPLKLCIMLEFQTHPIPLSVPPKTKQKFCFSRDPSLVQARNMSILDSFLALLPNPCSCLPTTS